jgi:hypothetical protein
VESPDIESTVHWHDTFDNDERNRWFRELIIEMLRPAEYVERHVDDHVFLVADHLA